MPSIGQLLATNPAIVALANLGGLIGLIIVGWGGASRLLRFAKSIFQNNVRVAVRKSRLLRMANIRLAAVDVHIFIAALALGILRVIYAVVCLLLFIAPKSSHISELNLFGDFLHGAVGYVAAFGIVSTLFVIVWQIFSTYKLAADVYRRRIRLARREKFTTWRAFEQRRNYP